jgi:hypothetical protein
LQLRQRVAALAQIAERAEAHAGRAGERLLAEARAALADELAARRAAALAALYEATREPLAAALAAGLALALEALA